MSAESFASFYQQYYRLILTVAQQRLGGATDPEDVTAEVFRIAWKHGADGHLLTLPWLYQVLRNVIGNEYRRSTRAARLIEHVGARMVEEIAEPGSDDAIQVRQAIQLLSPEDRELIYMTYWEDLSGQEIASILGCTAVTVRVRLLRARRKLRSLLEAPQHTRQESDHGRP